MALYFDAVCRPINGEVGVLKIGINHTNGVPKDLGFRVRSSRKEHLKICGDMHRFFYILAKQLGFKVVEITILQFKSDSYRRVYNSR